MSEHTKTPWKFRLSQRGSREVTLKRDHWELGGADKKCIGLIFGDDEANAACIVRCVNSHEALVRELEWMLLETEQYVVVNSRNKKIVDWQKRTMAALKLANP